MKQLAVLGVVTLVFVLAACGGSEKPPLTPDQDNPTATDGGSDMPTGADPAAAAPAAPAAPAK